MNLLLQLLLQMHNEYMQRLHRFHILIGDSNPDVRLKLIGEEVEDLKKDQAYIKDGGIKAKKTFEGRSNSERTTQKKLKELCWAVHEHSVMEELIQEAISTLLSL